MPAFEQNENAVQPIVADGFIRYKGLTYSLFRDTMKDNNYITELNPEEGGIYSVHIKFPGISDFTVAATDTVPFCFRNKID